MVARTRLNIALHVHCLSCQTLVVISVILQCLRAVNVWRWSSVYRPVPGQRERERESMVRVTDNSGLLAVMMCVKTVDMVGNWFVQESIICSKRDSILSYPRSVPWLTVELVPPDMEYTTITSIKSLEIGIRASADVTRGKNGKWRAFDSAYMAPIFTGLVGRNARPSYVTMNRKSRCRSQYRCSE
jgi:hypothetical protein